MKTHYNIFTSSDDRLVPQIAISLTAVAKNLSGAQINFYLLHSQITQEQRIIFVSLKRII